MKEPQWSPTSSPAVTSFTKTSFTKRNRPEITRQFAATAQDRRDLFTDPVVLEFNRATLGGIATHTTAAEAANALLYDRFKGMT